MGLVASGGAPVGNQRGRAASPSDRRGATAGRLYGLGFSLTLLIAGPIDLLTLHGPEGQQILLNPAQVTTMRSPQGGDLGHFALGTHCVIVMTSGKFVPVREDCNNVRDQIELAR